MKPPNSHPCVYKRSDPLYNLGNKCGIKNVKPHFYSKNEKGIYL